MTVAVREFCFSAYGARVVIGGDSAAVEDLERDFSGFPSAWPGEGGIRLILCAGPFPHRVERPLGSWRGCRWSDEGPLRTLEYPDGSGAMWDYSREAGSLWSPRREVLHELAYLFVHSRLGVRLDERGYHRAHALGFSWRGDGVLLFLPEGGGKTTLALHLARRPEFALLSDDIPLVEASGRRLWAFPQRLSVREDPPFAVPAGALRPFMRRRHGPKTLLDLHAYPGRLAETAPLGWVIVGKPGPGAPSIRRAPSLLAAPAVLSGLAAGVGTPQVLELMAPSGLGRAAALARTAASRLRASVDLLSRANSASFELGGSPASSARVLAEFLESGR